MSLDQARVDLDHELRDLVRAIEWSCYVVQPSHHLWTEVTDWCEMNIGSQFGLTWLDIPMVRRTRYYETPQSMLHFNWLRADAWNQLTTYAFRRDIDAVHFKLRWF